MTTVALKLSETAKTAESTAQATRRRTGLRRTLAHRWDLIGVLSLLAASAAYALYALAHLA